MHIKLGSLYVTFEQSTYPIMEAFTVSQSKKAPHTCTPISNFWILAYKVPWNSALKLASTTITPNPTMGDCKKYLSILLSFHNFFGSTLKLKE